MKFFDKVTISASCALLTLIVVGCTASQLASVSAAGQLFCTKATADGPLVVGILDAVGVPFVVTGLASDVVASACTAWDAAAVPVAPPAATVPNVAVAAVTSPTTVVTPVTK